MLALLAAAIFTDVRSARIPNLLTFGGMLLGLAFNFTQPTPAWWSIAGIGLAFALMFPGYLFFGAVKAGDAKLLMAVGAFLGPTDILEACLLTYILNIPFGLFVLAVKGRLGNIPKVLRAASARSRGEEVDAPEATVVIFAPVVAAAVVIARLVVLFQW